METIRVLVAEPFSDDRTSIAAAFRATNRASVTEASDGPSALHALQQESFDLVLISRSLPRFDGPAFFRWIRDNEKKSVFVLLADDLKPGWAEMAKQIKAYDLLLKPPKEGAADRLLDAVERMRNPLKVLVVQPSEAVGAIVAKLLTDSRFAVEVSHTGSGGHAVKTVALASYDVVLVDLGLPDMSGFEAVAKMADKTSSAKFILIGPSREVPSGLTALGVNAYLCKPFQPHDLETALHKVFGLWTPYLLKALCRPAGGGSSARVDAGPGAMHLKPTGRPERPCETVRSAGTGDPNSVLFNVRYDDGRTTRVRIDRAALRGGDHLANNIIREKQHAGQLPSGAIVGVEKLLSAAMTD
jgi:CheY-like chemotaxis protein